MICSVIVETENGYDINAVIEEVSLIPGVEVYDIYENDSVSIVIVDTSLSEVSSDVDSIVNQITDVSGVLNATVQAGYLEELDEEGLEEDSRK